MGTNANRHAALAPLRAVVDDARWYGQSSSVMHSPFDDLSLWFSKVETIVLSRGTNLLLIDFPDMGKIYDSSLSAGFLDLEKLDSTWRDPTKLGRILFHTFGVDGKLVTDDPGVVFFTRQILYMYKKIAIECPKENIQKAVDQFIDIERELRAPTGPWDADVWDSKRLRFSSEQSLMDVHPRAEKLWSLVDTIFSMMVPKSSVDILSIRPKHGPGAVADMKSGGDKYSFPNWPSKLEGVFPWCAFAQHREDLHVSDTTVIFTDTCEPPARLIAVPKTYKGPRLIASEPIAHQFLQQGLMRWMRQNLHPTLRTSIDFLDQTPSKEAALHASKVGTVATVDLSSASDRLSCWTVERAFGSNQSLLQALHAVRTRTIVDGTGTYDSWNCKLKKFAAQGSAVTFPVQTIVYTCLCYAALCFVENIRPTSRALARVARKVRVFGDDIIIPRAAVPVLGILLHSLQLKVNVDKTHTTGAFRESCGMDAWRGHDVTPCYLHHWSLEQSPHKQYTSKSKNPRKGVTTRVKYTAEAIISWVDVSNNAYSKGLWHLASYMTESIPASMRKLMPVTDEIGDGARLTTFQHGFVTDGRTRYSKEWQILEANVLASRTRSEVVQRGSWQDFYQYLIETPDPESHWISGYLTKNTLVLSKVWVRVP